MSAEPIEVVSRDLNGDLFTARTFLEAIRLSNSTWWNEGQRYSHWVFRGHADAGWRLIPSAWRTRAEGNPLLPLVDAFAKLPLCKIETAVIQRNGYQLPDLFDHSILAWLSAEHEALYHFAYLANSLGFNVEPVKSSPLSNGSRSTRFLFDRTNKNTALAQHHGVPTRFLD